MKKPKLIIKNKTKKQHLKFLKLENKDYSFGLSSIIFLLLCLIVLFLIIHGSIFLIFSPRARRITNLSKVYILSIESWNAYFVLHTAVVQTLFYNNTFKMWDGKLSTYDFYYDFRDFTKEYILNNLTTSIDYDLGNYTEKYVSDLTKV